MKIYTRILKCCEDCPEFRAVTLTQGVCYKVNDPTDTTAAREIKRNGKTIPKWCPLPDKV
jgi:hypothetical protein